MTPLHRQVLAFLAQHDATPTAIALVLGLDVSTVQQLLVELEQDGLIEGVTVH